MTWPGWTEVLPTLALLIGLGATLVGMRLALMRIFRSVGEVVGRAVTDRLKTDFTTRMDGLTTHLTKRMDGLTTHLTKHMDGIQADLTKRMDGLSTDLAKPMDGIASRLDRMDTRMRDELAEARRERRELAAGIEELTRLVLASAGTA